MEINQDIIGKAVEMYENEKMSLRKIAKYFNIKSVTLSSILHGKVKIRKAGSESIKISNNAKQQIIDSYKSGVCMSKISKALNVDVSIVKRVLHSSNIEIKTINQIKTKYFNIEKIKNLYDSGESVYKIAKSYNVSRNTMLKYMRENNLELRFTNRSDGLRKKYSEQTEKDITNDYNIHCLKMYDLSKKYNLSESTISKIIRNNNQCNNFNKRNTIYNINDSYFDNIDSSEKYYILGLLFTDGYVRNDYKYGFGIQLKKEDSYIIEYIKEKILSNHPINKIKQDGNYHSRLFINNKKIAQKLTDLGCVQRKSLTLQYPKWINENMIWHFLHGAICGDGTIYSNNKNYIIKLVGASKDFIENISKNINKKINSKASIYFRRRIYDISYSGINNFLKICNLIFKDAPFIMKRKYLKFKSTVIFQKELIKNNNHNHKNLELKDLILESTKICDDIDSRFADMLK